MELVKATAMDLEQALEVCRLAAEELRARGLDARGLFRDEEELRAAIGRGTVYIRLLNGRLAACVTLETEMPPEAEEISWSCGTRGAVLSRLAVHPQLWRRGIGSGMVDDAAQLLRARGFDSIRCVLSADSVEMLRILEEKMGFRRCGILPARGEETERLCLDKPLKRETPLLPVRMTPAFRGGSLTPWGGERLKTLYGKRAQETTVGESLEVSCIPGLESRDPLGRTLPQLIAEYGRKLVGRFHDRPFPLLLKLIDARESLSVQVHPDNEYARRNENGKLGKTEAWLILETPEGGGELVYGIKTGVSLKELREAAGAGSAMEPMLRRIQVRPGDVCYIPAGCVHAIGAGIVLYEIQESSDITYRFYDWDRTDSRGNRRELHLEQALAVTNLRLTPYPIHVERAVGIRRVLNEEYFTLDVIRPGEEALKLPRVRDFGFLTALAGELTLSWDGGRMRLGKGETCFLPAEGPAELLLSGKGSAALSMPG